MAHICTSAIRRRVPALVPQCPSEDVMLRLQPLQGDNVHEADTIIHIALPSVITALFPEGSMMFLFIPREQCFCTRFSISSETFNPKSITIYPLVLLVLGSIWYTIPLALTT